MDNKAPLYILLGLGAAYLLMSSDNQYIPPPGSTNIPPGGNYGGFTNNSNIMTYVTAGGQILNALGQIIGSIINFTNQNGTSTQAFVPATPSVDNTNIDPMAPYYPNAPEQGGTDIDLGGGGGYDWGGGVGRARMGCDCNRHVVTGRRRTISGF